MDSPNRITVIEQRLQELEHEKQILLEELSALKAEVREPQIVLSPDTLSETSLTRDEKLKLFMDLFACRTDVYPRLWENKTKGTIGYSPVCRNEWKSGICGKPRTRCSACPYQDYAELTLDTIRAHLEGKVTIGTYAIRPDDTCTFLAADFDGSGWKEDISAYRKAAEEMDVPVYVERSRSGNGAHAWLFFSEPVSAQAARRLGTRILNAAMETRTSLAFESYDRFFPNQDYLPDGGFGNLIALPLQREPRRKGNAVFLSRDLIEIEKQWEYLAGIRKMIPDEISAIISDESHGFSAGIPGSPEEQEIQAADRDIGNRTSRLDGCFPQSLTIIIDSTISIPMTGMPPKLIAALRRAATFANPEFFQKQRQRFSTWNTPRYIFCGERSGDALLLPRALLEKCIEIFSEAGTTLTFLDQRCSFEKLNLKFKGALREDQEKAVQEVLAHEYGILCAPTGSGKTVMACRIIAERKVPTLILVHRKQILAQWKTLLEKTLSIEGNMIGTLGSGKDKRTRTIDIAMIQSITDTETLETLRTDYEQIIIDECHHIPAVSFESVLARFPVRFCLGMTATPYRKDGHHPILHMQCGPIRYELQDNAALSVERRVLFRETGFRMKETERAQPEIHEIWNAMIEDTGRLDLIVQDIRSCLDAGRKPIVLSDRKEHLESLQERLNFYLSSAPLQSYLFTGALSAKKREKALLEIQAGMLENRPVVIFATGSLVGEGFDLPALDTLFLTMPVSFKGRVIQYAGRLHREIEGKNDVLIYDYVDTSLGLTISMFKRRLSAYRKMGYSLDVGDSVKLKRWIFRSSLTMEDDDKRESAAIMERQDMHAGFFPVDRQQGALLKKQGILTKQAEHKRA